MTHEDGSKSFDVKGDASDLFCPRNLIETAKECLKYTGQFWTQDPYLMSSKHLLLLEGGEISVFTPLHQVH